MKKLLTLTLVAMLAFVAMPAAASVQNIKVSGDIDSTWISRNNFDLGSNPTSDVSQSVFITQTRLRVDADLTDQVSATVALINEREWGGDYANANTINNIAGNDTDVDLNLAFVTLREMLYSPLTVVVGRQAFSYGNSLIVDSVGPNNAAQGDSNLAGIAADFSKQTAQDAIRLIFDYDPLKLEVLYSKLDENTAGEASDADTDDDDLYGVNATYELGDDMNTQVEAYFFARIDQSPNDNTALGATKSDTLYVPGLRASADVLDGLNIQVEMAWQRGNDVVSSIAALTNVEREAMAAQFISNYQIPNDILPDALEEYKPVLNYTYTYVSGDSNPTDQESPLAASATVQNAWDPLLENQGAGTIYNALFNLTNLHIHSVSLAANPIEDVTSKITWSGLWLDKEFNDAAGAPTTTTLISPSGATNTPAVDRNKTELGFEIDWDTTYDYTEDVQIGASFGWFVPGDVFIDAYQTSTATASQAIIHGNVNF